MLRRWLPSDESAEAILQAAEHAVRADFKDLCITATQVDSPADEALVELSRSARLIVLGSDEVVARHSDLGRVDDDGGGRAFGLPRGRLAR